MKDHEIVKILSEAFLPYKCEIELWDYRKRIRLSVYDKDENQILNIPELLVSDVKTQAERHVTITNYKKFIESKGYSF